jgi:hypothetical protein
MPKPTKRSPRPDRPKPGKRPVQPPAGANKRLADQTRKLLAKHYAKKYRLR